MEEKDVALSPAPKRWKQAAWLVGLIVAFFVATELAGFVAALLKLPPVPAVSVGQVAILLVALVFALADGQGFRSLGVLGRWQGYDAAVIPGLIFVQFAGSILSAVIMAAFGQLNTDQQAIQQVFKSFVDYPPGTFTLIALGLALQAGIGEELLFRGYLVSRLERLGLPGWSVIVVSGLLFGLVHWPGYSFWSAISKGIFFGIPTAAYFYYRRNLGPLMIAHALLDFIGFMAMYGIMKLMPNLPGL